MILTATGAVGTGLTPAGRRCLDGTFAAVTGTYTEDGSTGSYKFALSQADTNANDVSIITTATGCIPVCVNFVTTAADPTDSVRFGLTGLANAVPGAAGGLFIAGTNAATTITTGLTTHFIGTVDIVTTYTGNTPQTGDNFARLGAPAGASVSADIVAINAKTTNLPAAPASTTNITAGTIATVSGNVNGNVGGSVASVTGLTASNLDATISSRLASASYTIPPTANQNADALLDRTDAVETGWSIRMVQRILFAVLGGKASGMGTATGIFRSGTDAKDRVTATIDASGNRTAVTLDGS